MSSKLKLVNTLSESRLFRTKKMAGDVNINDAADLVFVHFLVLNIFNKDYDFAPLASSVAGRTMSFRNFDYFRTNGTDLYMALNRLMGKDNDIGDNEKDEIAKERIAINKPDVLRFLNHYSGNRVDASFEQRMLLRFQGSLNIQDGMLKSVRRLVGDWDNLSQNQKALVVTRLVQWMRRRARLAEILPALLKLQKRGNYNVDDKKDTKKKMWDKPIVKAGTGLAAIVGLHKGASELGKRLGKTTYTTQKGKLGRKFNS
jgi:hypothetical protein|tara:strand:- start:242 stop:1015 length:774 start_codon:yes stop_codon:yes gene_type:complete